MIRIDRNIPLPPYKAKGRRPGNIYPFRMMAIGDSFFTENVRAFNSVPNGFGRWESRTIEEKGKRGIRIWRIG